MRISKLLVSAVFVLTLASAGLAADEENLDLSKPEAVAAVGSFLAEKGFFTESVVMLKKVALFDKSEFEEAVVFETVPKLLAAVYEERAGKYFRETALNRALLDYSESIALVPDATHNSGCYSNTGTIYLVKARYDKAIEFYKKVAVEGAEGDAETKLSNLGFAYYLNGDLENAEKSLSAALAINKDLAAALTNVAQVYIAMNDVEKAKTAMEYLEKSPVDASADYERLALSTIYKELVKEGKLPDSVEAGRTASAAMDKEDYDTALRYFMTQRILDPNNPAASRNAAACYEKLNNRLNAIEYYSRYLLQGRDKADRAEIESRINRLSGTRDRKKTVKDKFKINAAEEDCRGVLNSGFTDIEEGDFKGADEEFEDARNCFLIVSGGVETGFTTMTLSASAKAAMTAGNYEKALGYSEAALESVEELPEKDRDPRLLASLFSNMAMAMKKYGRNEEALDYYTQALGAIEKTGGTEPEMLATVYDNMGNLYQDMDNNETALEYHLKALKIVEERYRSDDPERAMVYNNIAGSYYGLKNTKKAIEYAEKALAIMKKNFGENHPNVAMAYDNIAAYFMDEDKFEEALDYRLKAKDIFEKALGENNPETAALLSNLGYTYFKMGEYEKAIDSIQKALKILLETFDENHPSVLSAYGGLAAIYKKMGDDYNESIYMNKARGKR